MGMNWLGVKMEEEVYYVMVIFDCNFCLKCKGVFIYFVIVDEKERGYFLM